MKFTNAEDTMYLGVYIAGANIDPLASVLFINTTDGKMNDQINFEELDLWCIGLALEENYLYVGGRFLDPGTGNFVTAYIWYDLVNKRIYWSVYNVY